MAKPYVKLLLLGVICTKLFVIAYLGLNPRRQEVNSVENYPDKAIMNLLRIAKKLLI